jgi:Caspase domain
MTAWCKAAIWAILSYSICGAQISAAQTCPQDQPRSVNRPVPAAENPKVCRFDRPTSAEQPAYWWQLLYELFKWKPVSQPPFRRSIAFLAGVSHYNRVSPQLGFVSTDLTELRNFLLTDGGFDTVYEVRDNNVNRQLIEDFMGKYFSSPKGVLGEEDRLLFYYSGHGDAQSGVEPYLLFQNANPPYDYTDALPVRDVYRWARTVTAKHLLIILDSCFSGLAQDKAGPEDVAAGLSNALAGEPSGLLLTAGTGDERAYAVQYSKQHNGSIFTHALIDALRNMSRTEGIVTIGEAFEHAKVTVAAFDAVENRKMTPLATALARRTGLGKGNFIFINPKAENPTLPPRLYGGGSAITKAPDYVDENLTLIQKEYDEVKDSKNLEALQAFDSAYKGKPYGQALVYLIEEKITRLDPEHSRADTSSKEFVRSKLTATESLEESTFEQRLKNASTESIADASSQQKFQKLVADINAKTPIPGVEMGNSGIEYDVILQPGHYQRTSAAIGTSGKYVSEQALVAYVTNIVASTLRSFGKSVLVVSADNYIRPTQFEGEFNGLRSKVFLAIHADGSEPPCSTGPSLAYKEPAPLLALHAIGFSLSAALGDDYLETDFAVTEGRYYMFKQVRAPRLTAVLELGELTCEKSERKLIMFSPLIGANVGRAIDFILSTPEAGRNAETQ